MAETGLNGFTILHATAGQIAHECAVEGYSNDRTQEAVICVDLMMDNTVNGYGAYGQIEAYCQTPAGVALTCKEIVIGGAWAFAPNGGTVISAITGACGNGLGPACSTGRLLTASQTELWFTPSSSCGYTAGSEQEEWTIDKANTNTIILPDGEYITKPSTTFETNHYYMCY